MRAKFETSQTKEKRTRRHTPRLLHISAYKTDGASTQLVTTHKDKGKTPAHQPLERSKGDGVRTRTCANNAPDESGSTTTIARRPLVLLKRRRLMYPSGSGVGVVP